MEWVIWLVLFGVAMAFQFHALLTDRYEGMLTWSVRWLRVRLVSRIALFGAWSWLTWHWFLSPRSLDGAIWDDILAVLVGVALAIAVNYNHYEDRK